MTKMMTKYQIPSFALSRICKLNTQVSYLISDYIIWNRKINDDDNKNLVIAAENGKTIWNVFSNWKKKTNVYCFAASQQNLFIMCLCDPVFAQRERAQISQWSSAHSLFSCSRWKCFKIILPSSAAMTLIPLLLPAEAGKPIEWESGWRFNLNKKST